MRPTETRLRRPQYAGASRSEESRSRRDGGGQGRAGAGRRVRAAGRRHSPNVTSEHVRCPRTDTKGGGHDRSPNGAAPRPPAHGGSGKQTRTAMRPPHGCAPGARKCRAHALPRAPPTRGVLFWHRHPPQSRAGTQSEGPCTPHARAWGAGVDRQLDSGKQRSPECRGAAVTIHDCSPESGRERPPPAQAWSAAARPACVLRAELGHSPPKPRRPRAGHCGLETVACYAAGTSPGAPSRDAEGGGRRGGDPVRPQPRALGRSSGRQPGADTGRALGPPMGRQGVVVTTVPFWACTYASEFASGGGNPAATLRPSCAGRGARCPPSHTPGIVACRSVTVTGAVTALPPRRSLHVDRVPPARGEVPGWAQPRVPGPRPADAHLTVPPGFFRRVSARREATAGRPLCVRQRGHDHGTTSGRCGDTGLGLPRRAFPEQRA